MYTYRHISLSLYIYIYIYICIHITHLYVIHNMYMHTHAPQAAPGTYRMCWCPEGSFTGCDAPEDLPRESDDIS